MAAKTRTYNDITVERPDAVVLTPDQVLELIEEFFGATLSGQNLKPVVTGTSTFPRPDDKDSIAYVNVSFVSTLAPTNPVEIARFRLWNLPRCLGMGVSTDAWVAEDSRGSGIGGLMQGIKVYLCRKLDINALICTVRADNKPQIALLNKHGWRMVYGFNNKRSNNDLLVWTLDCSVHEDWDDDIPF